MVQDPVAQMEKTTPGQNIGENTPPEIAAEATEVKNDAEASDAKDTTTQLDAELNESKPADEAQLDKNEELERQ